MRRWRTAGLWRAPRLWRAPGLCKTLGIAGFLGVAATGAVIVRSERRRRSYTPDELRERLHDRLDDASGERP